MTDEETIETTRTLFPLSESQLLAGLTPELAPADLLANPLQSEIDCYTLYNRL